MLNVNQITSYLAKLRPDSALQKYAQMHKDDPYIMALTMSEFNRRKQTRQGAQMNAPEQPKVVDQAIQSMGAPMPEDVGIAQLPAGNMNFADGGIVAFSDGGDVNLSPAQVRQKLAEAVRNRDIEGAQFYRNWLETNVMPARSQAPRAVIPGGLRAPVRQEPTLVGQTPATQSITPAEADAGLARVLPPQAPAAPAGARPGTAPGPGTGAPRQRIPSDDPSAAAGQPPRASAGAQDPLIAQLLRPVSATPTNFEPSQATVPTAEGIQTLFAASRPKPEDVVDPFAEQRQELTNLATLQNAQEQAALEKQIKERGLLGEKQEARLKAREEKLGKQEKDLGPLAMIQAGFAIMGGQSRSALQNIGLGAQVGFKGYREGLEKLEASRERIEDGLERIETARRSEGILNDQQRSALRREGNNIVREGKKEGINALTAELGVKRGEANALFNAGINVLTEKGKIGSAERTAAAQMDAANLREAQQQTGANVRAAAQLTTQERIAAMESAAKRADAATRLAEVKAQLGIKNDADLREIYAKSLILQQRFPDVNEYLKIMKGTGSTAGTDYSKWGTPAKVGP